MVIVDLMRTRQRSIGITRTLRNMSTINVNVKNSGKIYPIELDLTEPGLTFKLQIYSLTNIPPERQKVLLKGGQLKDDSDLHNFTIKEGQTIMVLGTPDTTTTKIEKPDVTVQFVEDVNPNDLNFQHSEVPSGLVNLGNTCYLNSSLQSIFKIKEVNQELTKLSNNPTTTLAPGSEKKLIFDLKELFSKMTAKKSQVTPLNFLTTLRSTFPQFSERGDHGFYKQQDAEEAFSQILSAILRKFPNLQNYFEIEFKTTTKCLETDEEPTYGFEESLKLGCHISIHTNFLKDGLINNLKETIVKNNESLGKNCNYEISRKITKLPKFLVVHFVRFFWKRETGKKSKILRKVQFPFELDVTDLVDDSIKEEQIKTRDALYKVEKSNDDESRSFKKTKLSSELSTREQYNRQKEELGKLQKKWLENYSKVLPESFEPTKGEAPAPLYELNSIIAHQGSSADSGHYQAFVKDDQDLDGNTWFKFNDDKVTTVNREKIESLAGGGEGDSALILIYKAVGLP